MAGGEGTRLRPMTANQPKVLLPVTNRPIMEHVLRLLKRHGFDETVVTVQFLAALVRNYFGDGEEFGMSLQYATEEMPLGTAGSVRNAEDALRDEPFLVISGDALTDMDLTGLVRFHKDKGALVTVALAKVPNPARRRSTARATPTVSSRSARTASSHHGMMFRTASAMTVAAMYSRSAAGSSTWPSRLPWFSARAILPSSQSDRPARMSRATAQ